MSADTVVYVKVLDVAETPVNSMFATRLPEQFNVILTDAVSETVNSVYSSTFTIDPALTTPTTPIDTERGQHDNL